MENSKAIIDILLMAITVDGEIHASEIAAIKKIIAESKYSFGSSADQIVDSIHTLKQEDIDANYKAAVETLKTLALEEKKSILKLVTKITDADKVMHNKEVKLISNIMQAWGID